MQKRLVIFLVATAIAALPAFAQTTVNLQPPANNLAPVNPLFRHIPPDAQSVYQFNLPVITTQLNWQDLAATFLVTKPNKPLHESANLLKDPAQAGVDITQGLFVAVKAPSADSAGYTVLILHLTDSAKFRAALHREVSELRTFSIPGKNRIRLAGKGKLGFAWNKELAVLVIAMPSPENTTSPNSALAAAKRGLAVIEGYNGSVYTTDPIFLQGFSDDAAIHIWAQQGKGLSAIGKTMSMFGSHSPLSQYLQATPGTTPTQTLSSVRLEAGRITIASSTGTTPESQAIYAKFNSRPLNMDLQSRIPPGRFLGLLNIRFDPLVINDILNKLGLRHLLDSIMTAKNFPLDTVLHAFKGDIQLVCMEPVQSSENAKPKLPLYFVTTIGDMSAFNRIAATLKTITDSAGIDSLTGRSKSPLAKLNAYPSVQNDILVISGSKTQSDGWFSNTEKRNTDDFLNDRMKNNPISLLIDFKTAAHFVESMTKDKEPKGNDRKLLDLLGMMDRLEITAGAVRNNRAESFMEFKLIDTSPNSLNNFIKLLR